VLIKGYHIILLLLCVLSLRMVSCAAQGTGNVATAQVGFCKPYLWLYGGWVASPRMPLLADINSDGYADFVYASSQDKLIDVSLNGKGWKAQRGQSLFVDLPEEIQALCAGHFGGKLIDLAVLGVHGELTLLLSTDKGEYPKAISLGRVQKWTAPAWILAGKVVSNHADDLVVVDATGQVLLLDSSSGRRLRQYHLEKSVVAAALDDFDGDRQAELAIHTAREVIVYKLQEKPKRLASRHSRQAPQALAMGDVDADGKADIFAAGRLYFGPDLRRSILVPGWQEPKGPVIAMLGNVMGRDRADLVLQHQSLDRADFRNSDCTVCVTWRQNDADWDADGLTNAEEAQLSTDPQDRDTDGDGLLDGWEVHGFAGAALAGMGASPRHKDVFVINQLYDDVAKDQFETFMNTRAIPYFASLPYTNLDGKQGFALHSWSPPPYLRKGNEAKSWQQVAQETFAPERIGLWHYQLINGIGYGIGGWGYPLADTGTSGTFGWLHEIGHQLGLAHCGKWSIFSPTYTSLMNYYYTWRFEDDPAKTHYSNGEFAKIILNDHRLPGVLPFPIERLRFLTYGPLSLRLKPAGKNATFVDWNMTGTFGAAPVRASIAHGYGVNGGPFENVQSRFRNPPETRAGEAEEYTDYAPELAVHHDALYLLVLRRSGAGLLDPNAPRPAPGLLVLRRYEGKSAWSTPMVVATEATGDPCGISDGRNFYIFYPTAAGLAYRFGAPARLSAPHLIPESVGAAVRAVNWQGRIIIFMHFDAERNIVYRSVKGANVGPARDLGIKSTIVPGPAVDTLHNQLLLGAGLPYLNFKSRWLLWRFDGEADSDRFRMHSREWLSDAKSVLAGDGRLTVLFDPHTDNGPDGRVYILTRSDAAGVARAWCVAFQMHSIAYKDSNNGWWLNRMYDGGMGTRVPIGGVFYRGDLIAAIARGQATPEDGAVGISYHADGIIGVDTGDFDDIDFMAKYGLARSILTLAVIPAAGPTH
jgi:hypothetical protein